MQTLCLQRADGQVVEAQRRNVLNGLMTEAAFERFYKQFTYGAKLFPTHPVDFRRTNLHFTKAYKAFPKWQTGRTSGLDLPETFQGWTGSICREANSISQWMLSDAAQDTLTSFIYAKFDRQTSSIGFAAQTNKGMELTSLTQ